MMTWIIPAYAGSTRPPAPRPICRPDHPRIRGEHKRINAETENAPGSSPHTRGALVDDDRAGHGGGIIPAYAGSTVCWSIPCAGAWDHPRIRGEHEKDHERPYNAAGSSPHTRGAPGCRGRRPSPCRIIPAYAGSTSCRYPAPRSPADHPRIRGEHDARSVQGPFNTGSSPHTRGAPLRRRPSRHRRRIIPAYAGSTAGPSGRRPSPGDHPRIRGEHQLKNGGTAANQGSSPHTRGARLLDPRRCGAVRIIPAYAGST